MVKLLGIDEAGRGPVIGSMFVAGVMVEEELDELDGIDVKDSKKLSDKKRERLYDELDDVGEVFVEEVSASEIDDLREVMSLNDVELKAFTDIIKKADPDKVIMDLPEHDGEKFREKVKGMLPDSLKGIDFVAEHEADDKFPVVSAASIIAKTRREKHVVELVEKYGVDFGSGYPHDEPTREFLKKFYQEEGVFPKETRMSWNSVQKLKNEVAQQSMEDY